MYGEQTYANYFGGLAALLVGLVSIYGWVVNIFILASMLDGKIDHTLEQMLLTIAFIPLFPAGIAQGWYYTLGFGLLG